MVYTSDIYDFFLTHFKYLKLALNNLNQSVDRLLARRMFSQIVKVKVLQP